MEAPGSMHHLSMCIVRDNSLSTIGSVTKCWSTHCHASPNGKYCSNSFHRTSQHPSEPSLLAVEMYWMCELISRHRRNYQKQLTPLHAESQNSHARSLNVFRNKNFRAWQFFKHTGQESDSFFDVSGSFWSLVGRMTIDFAVPFLNL